MTGRIPIEKRLIKIEEGIIEIKKKLCEMEPCEDEVVASEETMEEEE